METIIITDAQHAKRIRAAQVEFNAAIDDAYEDGISVTLDVCRTLSGYQEKCRTNELRIARRFLWGNDKRYMEL